MVQLLGNSSVTLEITLKYKYLYFIAKRRARAFLFLRKLIVKSKIDRNRILKKRLLD